MKQDRAGAWEGAFEFPLPGRKAKPRTAGLTMVMDKGLGIAATRDLLDLAAPYMDFLKLAFGTSALYAPALLKRKIHLVRSRGVDIYPGGTFLEVALAQGRLDRYLNQAQALGFTVVEVSDGTVEMTPLQRTQAIRRAREFGFRVITEVGKKDPLAGFDPVRMRDQVEADLADGAYKVIVEGRESGRGVGVYDGTGNLKEGDIELLTEGRSDPVALIWEAPEKSQQQDLIMRYGPNVNLGNVAPGDILSVEALRCGLRGDTLKAALRVHAEEVF